MITNGNILQENQKLLKEVLYHRIIHGHNIQLTFLFILHYAINCERNLRCICKILWNVL